MKQILSVLSIVAIAAFSTSCMKDFGSDKPGGTDTDVAIPADFDWKTTRDIAATVVAPMVDGVAAEYAVVRIYSSPVLTDANLVAKGVTRPSASFSTAVTLPAGAQNIYVRTTLPDGVSSVEMVAARSSVSVAGSIKKSVSASKVRFAAPQTRVVNAIPVTVPEVPIYDKASDFALEAVISETPTSMLDLGASYSGRAADKYFIPAGAVITANLDMNGNRSPYGEPVVYVAGALKFASLNIGRVQLVVLPGGVVEIGSLATSGTGSVDRPTFFVMEGGSVTLGNGNMGSKCIVNSGKLVINDDLDLNNSAGFFNTASGDIVVKGEIKGSNAVKIYNDGKIVCEDMKLNSTAEFYNCENADLTVTEECVFERNTTIYQRGKALFDDMTARGTLYVNCYTVVTDQLEGEQADIRISAGAALEVDEVEFNNTSVSMAAGSMFIATDYNEERTGGKNTFTASAGDILPVVIISDKAYTAQGHETQFSGAMEIVYDNEKYADEKKPFVIGRAYLTNGAYVTLKQSVVIASSSCNGGKEPVTPEPEPTPEEEFSEVKGVPYTCCFEDNWPYFGDYDMNDVVVVVSIDRMVSQDGSKIASMKVNWALKAAGTTYNIAFATQMEGIRTEDIASTSSTHTAFGAGAFASQNPEVGNNFAVVPFFNNTNELLSTSNTWKGQPAQVATEHATTISFAQPVAVTAVVESKMNFFIAAKSRSNEIHMPTYAPTAFALVGTGSFLPTDPYKFYDASGLRKSGNHMMWALTIPGEFRYPAENKDIREVYSKFLTWAASNGQAHQEWYNEEADEDRLF